MVVTTTQFTLAFEGEALGRSFADLHVLAPALLALGRLFDVANHLLNGAATRIDLRLEALGAGRFRAEVEMAPSIARQLTVLPPGETVISATGLKQLLLGGGDAGHGGVRGLVRRLQGRVPTTVSESDAGVEIRLDHETLTVPRSLMRLYHDVAIQTALWQLIEQPLARPGIEALRITGEDFRIVELAKDRPPSSPMPAGDTILAVKEADAWRLLDGETQIGITIADEAFRGRGRRIGRHGNVILVYRAPTRRRAEPSAAVVRQTTRRQQPPEPEPAIGQPHHRVRSLVPT